MPQELLDPRQAKPTGASWLPLIPIPVKIRRFGFFPNIDDWLPGDLLLVAQVEPDWMHRQISQAQLRSGYAEEDARWQHAAVYMDDGFVCEAGTSGVRYAPVFDYVGEHLIRVRRDPKLSPSERWKLAIQAVVRLGEPYNFKQILSLFIPLFPHSFRAPPASQFATWSVRTGPTPSQISNEQITEQ